MKKYLMYLMLAMSITMVNTNIAHAKTIEPAVLMWDLGDTLFNQSIFKISSFIGIKDSMQFSIKYGSATICADLVRDNVWQILETYEHHNEKPLKDAWFEGTISNQELLTIAHRLCDNYKKFKCSLHEKILRNTYTMMFTPDKMARIQFPRTDAVRILEECKRAKDTSGKPHQFYVLSNWDPESFKLIYEDTDNQPVFKHFEKDNIIVSGYEHDSKPKKSFFLTVAQKAHVKPEQCILIDDLEENCQAARALGMRAIRWDKAGEVRKKLQEYKVI